MQYKGTDTVINQKVIEFNQCYTTTKSKAASPKLHVSKKIALMTITVKHLADLIKDRDTYMDDSWFPNNVSDILKMAKELNQLFPKLHAELNQFIADVPCDCNFHIVKAFPSSLAGYKNSYISFKHEVKYISYNESPEAIKIKDPGKFETNLKSLLDSRKVKVVDSVQTILFSKQALDELLKPPASDHVHPVVKASLRIQAAEIQLKKSIAVLASLVPVIKLPVVSPAIPPDPSKPAINNIYKKVEPSFWDKFCPCCTIL